MVKRPYKRRQILIDRFQYQLLLINLLYFFTILLIFAAALFVPLIIQLESSTLSLLEQQAVADQFLSLHARVWPALLVAFLLFAIHSVFVSHRIAGPLMRFRNTFKAVASGDLSVGVTLRKHDYLGNEADVLNEMTAGLRTRIKDIKKQYEEMCGVVVALERAIEGGSVETVNQTIEALQVQLDRLGASTEQFRIGPDDTHEQHEFATHVTATSTSKDMPPLTPRERGSLPGKAGRHDRDR